MSEREILIEGYSAKNILALPDEEIQALIFTNKPVAFRIGTAEVLGEFKIKDENLIVELAHIDGGGEGVLPTILILAKQYAQRKNLKKIELIVYALNCANPNPKLRPILERKGFSIKDIEGKGNVLYKSFEI